MRSRWSGRNSFRSNIRRRHSGPRRIVAPVALGFEPVQWLCQRQQPYGQSPLGRSEATQTVIGELKARGCFSTAASAQPSSARACRRDARRAARRRRHRDLGQRAARGFGEGGAAARAIAIGHPHDQTLDALTAWLAALPSTRRFPTRRFAGHRQGSRAAYRRRRLSVLSNVSGHRDARRWRTYGCARSMVLNANPARTMSRPRRRRSLFFTCSRRFPDWAWWCRSMG